MNPSIAAALRERLLKTGRSQSEIGAATGLAQSTVGRFLRDVTDITLSNAERLLRFCEQHEAGRSEGA